MSRRRITLYVLASGNFAQFGTRVLIGLGCAAIGAVFVSLSGSPRVFAVLVLFLVR